MLPMAMCNAGAITWPRGFASAGLIFVLLLCNLSSIPAHAKNENKKDDGDESYVKFSHGKKVYTNCSVIGELCLLKVILTSMFHKQGSHVWGGQPELFMASHVLQMPIILYMRDGDAGGLISIAEYGQEYSEQNPIEILYHGFGHYDALEIPGRRGLKSRL